MKKSVIRFFAIVLAVTLASGIIGAYADSGIWECTSCGETGNTGNFCSNCGAARPADEWTCASCGQTGNSKNFCSNCGAARPAGNASVTAASAVNEWLEQIPGETDRVKVCLQGVQVSDYVVQKSNPDIWRPEHAVDGNETTCWQVSSKKGFKKDRIWIQLNTGTPQTVDAIWFKNGFWAYNNEGDDQNSMNSRIKDITVSFLYSGESAFRDKVDLTLKDEAFTDWQRRSEIGHHENVVAVKIVIRSSYQGWKYKNDICLSEVMLVRNAPAATAKEPAQQQAAVVYESRPDVTGAKLLMKLSTRSGPGTQYDGAGTFFGKNWQSQKVRVLGKYWDGSIWWVLVDFSNGGKASYRVWTGLKRVDVDINKVKDYYAKGQGTVSSTTETYRGPGGKYAKANVSINGWKDVEAYGRENGYVEVEFQQGSKWYRLWVPENVTSIDWGTDNSGNN